LVDAIVDPNNSHPNGTRENALDKLLDQEQDLVTFILSRHACNREIEEFVWKVLPLPIAEEIVPSLATLTMNESKKRETWPEGSGSPKRQRKSTE
jgi:hypothetical protein